MSALVTYIVVFVLLLQARVQAAIVVSKETAKPVALIVGVAYVGALGTAVRSASVYEATNTVTGRQQNKDLRCVSP